MYVGGNRLTRLIQKTMPLTSSASIVMAKVLLEFGAVSLLSMMADYCCQSNVDMLLPYENGRDVVAHKSSVRFDLSVRLMAERLPLPAPSFVWMKNDVL